MLTQNKIVAINEKFIIHSNAKQKWIFEANSLKLKLDIVPQMNYLNLKIVFNNIIELGTIIVTDNKIWYNFLDKKKIQIGP